MSLWLMPVKALVVVLVLLTQCMLGVQSESPQAYLKRRHQFTLQDSASRYGQHIVLSPKEKLIDDQIVAERQKAVDDGIKDALYPPSRHFFHAKPHIEQSNIFKIIKKMPKGGALHVHLISMIDPDWLILHATYRDDCYMCLLDGKPRFHFARKTPTLLDCSWRKAIDIRQTYTPTSKFDAELHSNLTIITDDPVKAYPTINDVWNKADVTFPALADLSLFKPIFPGFFKEVMRQYLADGIQYIETRGSLYAMYDYDGKYKPEAFVLLMKELVQQFKQENPSFIGLKFITEMGKRLSKELVGHAVQDAVDLHRKYPEMLAGFDLVAQEDLTHPILYYLEELLAPSNMNPPYYLPYFFHAGETNWEGTRVDQNLFDAILLNASRIGHGYASFKHPEVLHQLKTRDIPLEINMVSNQVLKLVDDLRNHPVAHLLANNYSIVISSDDPGLWGALPASHDFYELLMAATPMDQGLNVLKRLAMDSIRYSSLSARERAIAQTKWMREWNKFISNTIMENRKITRVVASRWRFVNNQRRLAENYVMTIK